MSIDGRSGGASRREFTRAALAGAGTLFGRSHALWADTRSVPAASGEERSWASLREQFLVPPEVAPLNAANLCPAPAPVLEAARGRTDLDHDLSPANRTRMHDAKETTRGLLAEFLRVSPEEVLITRNTSESNNLVSSGLDLGRGDEVVVFSDNHASNLVAWQQKARRFGFDVETVAAIDPHPGPERYLELFAAAMGPKTRVLAFTHLTNTVGDLFPAAELCRMARERGVLSLVDGAQSFGLMDVDLSAMQPDFYSGSAHKWLCGPKEVGLLYVRRAVQDRLWPTVVSLYEGVSGVAKTHEGFGQRDEPAIAGFAEAVRFQARVGRARIEARARELATALKEGLRRIDGVTVWTHADAARSHAVVSARPAGLDPERLVHALYEKDRVVAAVRRGADRGGVRFSPHFYNSHAEVERALAAVERYVASGL
jgi:selenocysteine lyase/cysteine desulfurase